MNTRKIFGLVFGVDAGIACAVFVLVCTTFVVALWLSRRRKRRGAEPSRRSKNTRLEVAYALVVASIAGFVIFLSFHTTGEENASAASGASAATAKFSKLHGARVDVTAFQWCWQFSYPGHHVSKTGNCAAGHLPTMVVPAGEPVVVRMTSRDVIHSWWVPHLRYKMDVFPDHVNAFTMTFDHTGRWIGRCAEYCGEYHFHMDFYLQVVSKAQYQRWLAGGGTGAPTA